MPRSIGKCGMFAATVRAPLARSLATTTMRLGGSSKQRCAPAQAAQVPRYPSAACPQPAIGQPKVFSKPAITVIPVIAELGAFPQTRRSVANAA